MVSSTISKSEGRETGDIISFSVDDRHVQLHHIDVDAEDCVVIAVGGAQRYRERAEAGRSAGCES